MTFNSTWHNLLENIEELPADAILVTPLSRKAFRVTDVQEHRVLMQYRDDDETVPLQKGQFETLYERISDSRGVFDLDRLPPEAEPYATVLSLHPRFEINDRERTLTESDQSTGSPSTPQEERWQLSGALVSLSPRTIGAQSPWATLQGNRYRVGLTWPLRATLRGGLSRFHFGEIQRSHGKHGARVHH